MQSLRVICLLLASLFSLAVQAQVSQPGAIKLYRQGDQIIIADSAGLTPPSIYPYTAISVVPVGNRIRLSVEGAPLYFPPNKVLSEQGVAYGNTVLSALTAYKNAAQYASTAGKYGTILATTFANAQTQVAALPVGIGALVKVAADESPGNAGTGVSGANPTTYYLFFPGIGLIQLITYPN